MSNIHRFWEMPFGEPEWITVPPGNFRMGKTGTTYEFFLQEFRISRTPITCAQYEVFVRTTGYLAPEYWTGNSYPEHKHSHPVTWVSWGSAIKYCLWLSEVLDKPVTLPSEPEWEKAARGISDDRPFPWGYKWDPKKCNCRQLRIGDTTPVDRFPDGVSPTGCLDMLGNVLEWTRSIDDSQQFPYPYIVNDGREEVIRVDSIAPSGSPYTWTDRITKGSWFGDRDNLFRTGDGIYEIGDRDRSHAINYGRSIGFRIVMHHE